MKLYNTLEKKLTSLNSFDRISIYLCGPTVYSDIHIGNCRPIIIFDVLVRYLKFVLKKEVFYIHNFTDIDDKIIIAAEREKLKEQEITKKYIDKYLQIWKSLNLLPASIYPRVTSEIQEIISFINLGLEKKFAYKLENGIYFDLNFVKKKYGMLSHQTQDSLWPSFDKNKDFLQKKNLNDFALWKFTKKGLSWEASFGKGRPGWHTECMCMIDKYNNGEGVAIHGGGTDLIFPHHENERAQYLVYKQKELADIWVHTGMLKVRSSKNEAVKMAKSEKNFITAENFLKTYGPNTLRYLFYSVHFHKQLFFELKNVNSIVKLLSKISKTLNVSIFQYYFYKNQKLNEIYLNKEFNKNIFLNFLKENIDSKNKFFEDLENNLNIPSAIATFNNVIKEINILIPKIKTSPNNLLNLKEKIIIIFYFSYILGFNWDIVDFSPKDIDIYKSWEVAVKDKDYKLSDNLRKYLIERGIV